ncbi:hypothetical protein AN216_05185 [Streptomyces oceani]|uniref:Uncharacterized protein n=1 Tax=Streptomyces oceani TaxID=1075402 RepID=A0A1E7KLX1_9ACTN|nr:hypothetical protein AN216_05185 [Streptomyces oceani]
MYGWLSEEAAAAAGETSPGDAGDAEDTALERGRGQAAERPVEDTEPAEAAAAEETVPTEGGARPEGAA